MKTLIAILLSMMLAASFSINAGSHDHEMSDGQKTGVLGDNHTRSMMMEQIADDPEMRQEMMAKMMQSMDMHKMMNDPEMKARMQKHIDMMQMMLNSEGMDQAHMQAMMDNPEMMSMMKMHMLCVQTAADGMQGDHPRETSEDHVH